MALRIEKTIDLTAYEGNTNPRFVQQLAIIHESKDGELVQYYIHAANGTQGDKATRAVGVPVKTKDGSTEWTYTDYDEVVWGKQQQRIAGNRIERLGVKAFPGVGAIAFYKLSHRDISRIVAPVNKENKLSAPVISVTQNADESLTVIITPPSDMDKKKPYKAYRIILDDGNGFTDDTITYDLTVTISPPSVAGIYQVYAIGYVDEGQICSRDSNVLQFAFSGGDDDFEPPYYSKEEVQEIKDKVDDTYSKEEVDQKIEDIIVNIQDGDEVEY